MSNLIRDNKALLQKIQKNTNLPQFCDMVYYGKTLTYILKAGLCSVTADGLLLTFTIPKNAFQWVEDKSCAYLCLDLSKVFKYNNIKHFTDNISINHKDLHSYSSYIAESFINEVLYMGGVNDDSCTVDLLKHYGIQDVTEGKLFKFGKDKDRVQDLINVVTKDFENTFRTIIEDNMNTKDLFTTALNPKWIFFHDFKLLGLVKVDFKSNVITTLSSKNPNECNIHSGNANCDKDFIVDYLQHGGSLYNTLLIDKKINFSVHNSVINFT